MTQEASTTRAEVLVEKAIRLEVSALGKHDFFSIPQDFSTEQYARYKHYVELVEPGGRRACIKCCDNTKDCPLNLDTAGCPAVIAGNYFDCR